jgi:hypothetical protein
LLLTFASGTAKCTPPASSRKPHKTLYECFIRIVAIVLYDPPAHDEPVIDKILITTADEKLR